ncbi:unnamed protein product [Cuscuta epithymum]|uniref:Uncharacterized protein n=1 Tax=Cuscuta epithymum TaxID=186058 RepID=A0AAV0CWD4_9ASTE|nr:unnamed protein product [Cuscuta epithymum]
MSGMLPGVECARRRRLHPTNRGLMTDSRKSFFCLYTSNSSSSIPSMQGSGTRTGYEDGMMMGEVAREAKQRLDEKLRGKWEPHHSRNGNRQDVSRLKISDIQRAEFGLENSSPKRCNWARNLGFKA